MWYVNMIGNYSPIKEQRIPFVARWMQLEIVIASQRKTSVSLISGS